MYSINLNYHHDTRLPGIVAIDIDSDYLIQPLQSQLVDGEYFMLDIQDIIEELVRDSTDDHELPMNIQFNVTNVDLDELSRLHMSVAEDDQIPIGYLELQNVEILVDTVYFTSMIDSIEVDVDVRIQHEPEDRMYVRLQ